MANVYVNIDCGHCGFLALPTSRVLVILAPSGDAHTIKAQCPKCKVVLVKPIPLQMLPALVANCACRVAETPPEATESVRVNASPLEWDEVLDFANELDAHDFWAAEAAEGLTVED